MNGIRCLCNSPQVLHYKWKISVLDHFTTCYIMSVQYVRSCSCCYHNLSYTFFDIIRLRLMSWKLL